MKVFKKVLLASALSCAGLIAPSMVSVLPGVDLAVAHAETKTKRVPALREKVYSQLARAQKLADEGDVKGGLEVLDSIKERSGSMNSYEIAMMHNFYGFIYYNENQLDKAIASFEQVVAEEAIPESLRLSTTFSLAQLAMANGDYRATVDYLERWKEINTQPIKSNYYVLKAQALYQDKNYQSAVENINIAISLTESEGNVPKESWLVLQRALYYSMNQPKKVADVLEKMVKLFDKPEYWVQLAGMFGELGKEKKQLALLETAKQRGFIKKRSDVIQLAQVYLFNGLPYKAAVALDEGIKNGVVEGNAKNYAFIAEAYVQSKDESKSIDYFAKADKAVDHGNYLQRIAEVYINLEKFDEAADAARAALDKGELSFESNAYVALGMAQYNLKNFDASILAFEQAEKHKKSANLAKQWIKYVKREKVHAETLKQALL
ncbi:tetratricopeptide repeat protein [Pseudoalteromonas sp. OOF1S-7]|uniref:tetratricopeptide repeat protein n=1 Tax=Pseudoalteromonas sp. OOF1S-7 TaxID=2917757 RepID=UPI001EF5EBA3|nr:tetratricopeptide repeat protein [Pseudoalteromonas sp. OOF1S-7]MCG7535462.1 tetratricopeptide repeat protein [Pseudoalteromonas sp. OOF1S-7]